MNPDWPLWLGSIPAWITSGTTVTAFIAWLRYLTQRRSQDGARLTDLEAENRRLRVDFDLYRRECVKETDELRARIRALEER